MICLHLRVLQVSESLFLMRLFSCSWTWHGPFLEIYASKLNFFCFFLIDSGLVCCADVLRKLFVFVSSLPQLVHLLLVSFINKNFRLFFDLFIECRLVENRSFFVKPLLQFFLIFKCWLPFCLDLLQFCNMWLNFFRVYRFV